MLCSDKFSFTLLLDLVIDLRSVLKTWNPLKAVQHNQKSHTAFDSALSIGLYSYIYSLIWSLKMGGSCAFHKACDPQRECNLLHKIEITYLKSHSKL